MDYKYISYLLVLTLKISAFKAFTADRSDGYKFSYSWNSKV